MPEPSSSETSSPSSSPTPSSSPNAGSPLTGAQQIVDTLHEPLLVLDRDLRVRQVNPAFHQVFGTGGEDTSGRPLADLGEGHFDHPVLRDALETLLGEHEPFEQVEVEGMSEEEGRRVFQVNGRLLDANREAPERILLAINDITEQRTLEETLRQRARELARSNEDLEQFAYAASHDLQEPLRMVSSYLQLLERRYKEDLDETAQEFIGYAVDGAERMKALINGLLQYSRVGRKEGEFGEVGLGEVLDEILSDLERRIHELDATIERGSLPQVYGNRGQLRRLLQNLVENALTYHGEEPPRVSVSGTREEEGVHLVVRDDGPGIPPEGEEKIFQIFGQLDPHGTGQEGSGMGLALCRKIANRHDGQIWVESEPEEGCAFHVTLRLSPTTDA
ncbi:sensor histidine kinase [Salinibacter ruber]|uniref:sensor histidine kinase n=1 Tax=Salinibacter ruber TaxID=146919 RepID=UPI0020731978|nr:ATP-binding protein [Salinibacter ruber]